MIKMTRSCVFLMFMGMATVTGCNQSGQPIDNNPTPNNSTATTGKPPEVVTKSSGGSPVASIAPSVDRTKGYLRAMHAVPGAGPVTVTASSANMTVSYGRASDFVGIPPGKLEVFAAGSDGKKISGPMPLTLDGGEDATIIVNGVPGDVALMPFKHKNRGPLPGRAKVAFLHAAKGLPPMDIEVDGNKFRYGVKYGVATDYQELPIGTHNMNIFYPQTITVPSSAPPPPPLPGIKAKQGPTAIKMLQRMVLRQPLDLAPGKVYSVVVFRAADKSPVLLKLEDKFVPSLKNAPVGGAPSRPLR